MEEDFAVVTATSAFVAKPGQEGSGVVLDGRESFVDLVSVELLLDDDSGRVLSRDSDFAISPNGEDTRMTVPFASFGTRAFSLRITTKFKPQENFELSGLYKSSGTFCTQCEAEGFRLITYFPDRPDVMSVFTVSITAEKSKYPVLLSNGNLLERVDVEVPTRDPAKHRAVWFDPHRKPCYLFALVAGNLSAVEDSFETASGRVVQLRVYAEPRNVDRCDFAMACLKRAMRWDETRFGLEYDLDLFNIVAVDDFNMGAMENKSLNIFNSRLVLATPDSATDAAFARIESVIAHEYFHNWTGNRVTCRDWFQLSLKEGLTVFRDQEFSADISSRAVRRIADVRFLRDSQFAEDASPVAHPIRPASYQKIDNFYTSTVYEKGAEVVRMYETLLGKAGFRKAMDLYFERHDGRAVTCDDFFAAARDANPDVDILGVHNWYHQAGTPVLKCARAFDASRGTYALTFEQVLPKTPDADGGSEKRPQLIPIETGVLRFDTGADVDLSFLSIEITDELEAVGKGSRVLRHEDARVVLVLSARKATFTFSSVSETDRDALGSSPPIPSLLRGFSAPVTLELTPELSVTELTRALANDTDPFNRWEAAQKMARAIMRGVARSAAAAVAAAAAAAAAAGTDVPDDVYDAVGYDFESRVETDEAWIPFTNACAGILDDAASNAIDRAWVEEALRFPGVSSLIRALQPEPSNPIAAYETRRAFEKCFARRCAGNLKNALDVCAAEAALQVANGEPYGIAADQVSRRSLRAYCLRMLALLDPEEASKVHHDVPLSLRFAFDRATNMTEVSAALAAVSTASANVAKSRVRDPTFHDACESIRKDAFDSFLSKWKADATVSCAYLSLVAAAPYGFDGNRLPVENVARLAEGGAGNVYDFKVPNKFYALIGGFARGNVPGFHALDGSGYDFVLAKVLEMDAVNPIAAARAAQPFTEFRLLDEKRKNRMRGVLESVLRADPSPNLREICSKSLAGECD